MSVFKKKPAQSIPSLTTQQLNNKLNLLLGLGSSSLLPQNNESSQPRTLSRQLILACAMFWDSKKRIDKIKSLILKQQSLTQFASTQDFQISELTSIQLLSLSRNKIMHLQPLSQLDTLVCLNINHNKVYDLTPLKQLYRLQELYACDNQIKHIDALEKLNKIRILNLYNNQISRVDQVLGTLSKLVELEELDIENNEVDTQENRAKFLKLQKLTKFNNELILQEERGPLMGQSMIVGVGKFRDTRSSFFMNKSQISTVSTSQTNAFKIKSKAQILADVQQLENRYLEIDDRFQEEIVKNVQMKSQIQRQLEKKKLLQRKSEENREKQEQIIQLKRKVKMLKQNLFNNTQTQSQRKCDLLRELFQLQMQKQMSTKAPQQKNILKSKKQTNLWVRKFDYDQQILIVPKNTQKSDMDYLMDQQQQMQDEDEQIAMLLNSNSSAIQQMKRELREMSN